jgi:hypothetical protein
MLLNHQNNKMSDFYFSDDKNEKTILYYKGPVTDYQLFRMANFLNDYYKSNPVVGRRFFSVFVEMAQNIAYHSAEKEYLKGHNPRGIGALHVEDHPGYVRVITSNVVREKQAEKVKKRCDEINKLEGAALRELRREMKQATVIEHENSGNFGLVQVALKSKNKVNYQIEPFRSHPDLKYMVLETILGKNN